MGQVVSSQKPSPIAAGGVVARALGAMRSALPCLVLLALPFVLFWQVWWPDPAARLVFAHGDFVHQHYPMRAFVAAELRAGRLPLWDPYTFGGEPAVAESLFASFYPLGLWQALFPGQLPFMALELEAIFHLGLAGVFTYLFVRRLTGRAEAGLLSGMCFSLGGFLTSYPMLQLIVLETAIWLPAALWLLEIALSRRSLGWVGLAGLVLGVSILAGFPQTFLHMGYVIGGYLLLRAWRLRLSWRFTLQAALILGAAALGLGAIQWLPSAEMAGVSSRANLGYEVVAGGFGPAELWGLLRPNAGHWSPLYVGLVALGLAVAAPILWRGRETCFWVVVALVALALSLGRHGFLYPLAHRVMPGMGLFRQQERMAFLVSFALAVLAGYGYAALASQRWWPRLAVVAVLALVFVDLFLANNGVILQTPRAEGYYPLTPAVQRLQQENDHVARVSSENLLPGNGNSGLLFRVRDVTGNGPLHLAHYDRFLKLVPEVRWFQMLNVRYLLTQRQMEQDAFQLLVEDGEQRLYDQSALGGRPAWIAHEFQALPDGGAAIAATANMDLDVFETAILERQPDPAPQPASGPEEVRITSFERHCVALEATLSAPGILVLSEVAYPGWVARVDGQPVDTMRAYGLLRAVALPAGQWHVEWHYEPLSFYLGAALSGLTMIVLGALGPWRWRVRAAAQAAALGAPDSLC